MANLKKCGNRRLISIIPVLLLIGGLLLGACNSNKRSKDYDKFVEEYLEDDESDKPVYAGTYTIEGGYKLIVRTDKTARLYTPTGKKIAAGVSFFVVDYISIDLDWDINDPLVINGENVFIPVVGIEKDYFYFSVSSYNAKNEDKRLKILSFSRKIEES